LKTVEMVTTAWRENVKIEESDKSWTKVHRHPLKIKSSLLRKSEHGSDGG
jgi:hypothetical protein